MQFAFYFIVTLIFSAAVWLVIVGRRDERARKARAMNELQA